MTNDKGDADVSTASQNAYQQRSLSESEYYSSRSKRQRYDPISGNMHSATFETKKYHRLIEKRRRDRINECIYQLKGLLPTDITKSTSKPMEKAVILELVVTYMQSISPQINGKSREYVKGYKECSEKVLEFLNSTISDTQKEGLQKCVDQGLAEPKDTADTAAQQKSSTDGNECLLSTIPFTASSQSSGIPKIGSAFYKRFSRNTTASTQEMGATERLLSTIPSSTPNSQSSGIPKIGSAFYARFNRNTDVQSTSSSSLGSSSPVSDLSLCADNSDSSGCYEMNNKPYSSKRKMYQHHHKTSTSHTSPRQSSSSTQQPMYMNVPMMFAPSMMSTPQFFNADGNPMNTDNQMPRMMQPFPVSAPTGVMMPQMCSDANGVQFPTFYMACGSQPRSDNQNQRQTQNAQMEPMVIQPTMMMPYRNQGNFVFMPSYPVMPQFQAPALVPVQTQAEEGSNTPSE